MKKRIGLIAGSGRFPILFSDAARSQGFAVYAVAHHQETDPVLESHVDTIQWLHLGQIRRIIKFFKYHGVNEAVMVGAISKTKVLQKIRPDLKAISILTKLHHTHDDNVLRAVAGALEKEGIMIRPSTFIMPEILAPSGCWTKRKPSRSEIVDMKIGFRIAKEIGRLDIGQCVVVSGGSVVAVETVEGTDATIRRGGSLGKNAVVIKVCKPIQDQRFDMPATGVQTVRTMIESGAGTLLLEANRAVVFDRSQMIALADKNGIAIEAWETG